MKFVLLIALLAVQTAFGQFDRPPDLVRTIDRSVSSNLTITNRNGRVIVKVIDATDNSDETSVKLYSDLGVTDREVKQSGGSISIEPASRAKRIDVVATVPVGANVRIVTDSGSIEVSGRVGSINARSGTGTIAFDIPVDEVRYSLTWTESRPRFVSDIELVPIRERSAGRFEIKGVSIAPSADRSRAVKLDVTTARGIVLINVPANEVSSDLKQRPLTNAAKAIIRSGDSLLMEAIRRASPRYFSDYAQTLPPMTMEPRLRRTSNSQPIVNNGEQTISVRVTDARGRAVNGIGRDEFQVNVAGKLVEVKDVKRSTAPFDLVLLADVSGSVENYINFIRKAAREFVETVDERDRVALIVFNDDVNQLTRFTSDKASLSASLDTFDAGGGTALYDALAFVLADTLRGQDGGRSAIVVLSDGDDNSSFLAFDSLIGSIQESGSLIYPMYVPSGLIAASTAAKTTDPLRFRYLSLSAKSEREGERMAELSGGVFYRIESLEDIGRAYRDIVEQLRSSYELVVKSDIGSGRPRVSVRRENVFVTIVGNSSN